jgi:adenylate kinase family enzyme
VPRWLAMLRIARRIVTGYGPVRPDSAEGCAERLDLAFLHFAWSWNRIRRSRTLALVARFHRTKIVLHGAKQQKQFWRAVQEA